MYTGDAGNALRRLCLSCRHDHDGEITAVDPANGPRCQYENICAESPALGARPSQARSSPHQLGELIRTFGTETCSGRHRVHPMA